MYGRRRERANATAEAIRALVGACVEIVVSASLEETVATADIVSCSTSSATPVLAGKWLKPTNAAERSAEAHRHALQGEQNGAIGTVLDLDRILDEAKALYTAAIALHRTAGF